MYEDDESGETTYDARTELLKAVLEQLKNTAKLIQAGFLIHIAFMWFLLDRFLGS